MLGLRDQARGNPIESESQDISALFSYYDEAFISLINDSLNSPSLQFENIFYQSNSKNSKKIGPLSIGQALVLNKNETEEFPYRHFAGTISAKIKINGEAAGNIDFQWRPTAGALCILTHLILYYMDRAYLWPEFILERFPNWFDPELKKDYVQLKWYGIDELLAVKNQKPSLENLVTVISQMKIMNPEMESFEIHGLVAHFGIATKNKTIFILNLEYLFGKSLSCQQRLRTDYNPVTLDLQRLQMQMTCNPFNHKAKKQGTPNEH
jgi:hypothetical protein